MYIKSTLEYIYNILQYEIHSPVVSNETQQWNSKHSAKLPKELCNMLHNISYWKIDVSLCFGFVKQVKNQFYIFNLVFKLLAEKGTLTW